MEAVPVADDAQEAQRLRRELEELQRSYDELVADSKEYEGTLETSLEEEQQRLADAHDRISQQDEAVSELRKAAAKASEEVSRLQLQVEQLSNERAERSAHNASLEQQVERLQEQCRRAVAAEETSHSKLEQALEDQVMLGTELDSIKAKYLEESQRLRTEIAELTSENDRLKRQAEGNPLRAVDPELVAMFDEVGNPLNSGIKHEALSLAEILEKALSKEVSLRQAAEGQLEEHRQSLDQEARCPKCTFTCAVQ
mmetsp:Transcript_17350/g.50636  ORF Transcript_17350/g.50636 Transcript_17350/m.50636 type:complete len:255 (-) Transcript_17350:29-793(-)